MDACKRMVGDKANFSSEQKRPKILFGNRKLDLHQFWSKYFPTNQLKRNMTKSKVDVAQCHIVVCRIVNMPNADINTFLKCYDAAWFHAEIFASD